jgi:hypothetical protein
MGQSYKILSCIFGLHLARYLFLLISPYLLNSSARLGKREQSQEIMAYLVSTRLGLSMPLLSPILSSLKIHRVVG